jgi:hypothetical protein
MRRGLIQYERLGKSLLKAEKYMLSVGGTVVNSGINDPLTAVGLVFGAFYVSNMNYPTSSAVTLEFIQR